MSEQEFIEALADIGIVLNVNQIDQFRKYSEYLLEYNTHTNLTAIKTKEEVYLKHFYDSLLLLKYIQVSGCVLDIGSGAGFPGIPLKIVYPNIDLYLLDSNGKKTTFLNKLRDIISLDYNVINDRAEKYIETKRESFDYVVCRAVAPLPVLAELSIPFVKVGGFFIAYKAQYEIEVEESKFAISTLGATIQKVESTTLYTRNDNRAFIIINKKCKTEIKYPRPFEKISKKPLQNLQK